MPTRPAGKPKRCLTAYNIFFQHERKRLLASLPVRNTKVKSKKAHGKIEFAELGRAISRNWKKTTSTERAYYQKLAQVDKQRYYKEMKVWRAQMEAADDSGNPANADEEDSSHNVTEDDGTVASNTPSNTLAGAGDVAAASQPSNNVRPSMVSPEHRRTTRSTAAAAANTNMSANATFTNTEQMQNEAAALLSSGNNNNINTVPRQQQFLPNLANRDNNAIQYYSNPQQQREQQQDAEMMSLMNMPMQDLVDLASNETFPELQQKQQQQQVQQAFAPPPTTDNNNMNGTATNTSAAKQQIAAAENAASNLNEDCQDFLVGAFW